MAQPSFQTLLVRPGSETIFPAFNRMGYGTRLRAAGRTWTTSPSSTAAVRVGSRTRTSPRCCKRLACGTICTREALPDSYGFNMDSGKIAKRLHDFFTLLSGSADVYMVRTKEDAAFHKARQELQSVDGSFSKYKRMLENARDRDCVFYPLKSIMKDTSAGGDLTKRFKALIEA